MDIQLDYRLQAIFNLLDCEGLWVHPFRKNHTVSLQYSCKKERFEKLFLGVISTLATNSYKTIREKFSFFSFSFVLTETIEIRFAVYPTEEYDDYSVRNDRWDYEIKEIDLDVESFCYGLAELIKIVAKEIEENDD